MILIVIMNVGGCGAISTENEVLVRYLVPIIMISALLHLDQLSFNPRLVSMRQFLEYRGCLEYSGYTLVMDFLLIYS